MKFCYVIIKLLRYIFKIAFLSGLVSVYFVSPFYLDISQYRVLKSQIALVFVKTEGKGFLSCTSASVCREEKETK